MIRSVWSNVRCNDILGEIAVGGGEVPPILSDHAFDHRNLAKPLDLRSGQSGIPVVAGLVLERDLHHTFRADIGKGIDQHCINNAENRAGGAHAERQREDRGQGEPRPPQKFAPRVAQIGRN